MLVVQCLGKQKDKNGVITHYKIQDTNKEIRIVTATSLKRAIRNGQITCVNLKLTEDNRLITINKRAEQIKVYNNKMKLLGKEEEFEYSKENSVAFAYKGKSENVRIPDFVKVIGNNCFYNSDVKTVFIPNSVKRICDGAFDNSSLQKVHIPDSVEVIENFAFLGCEQLTEVTGGKNVKKIGKAAFSGCMNLEKITLSEFIREIPDGCFSRCPKLTSIYIPDSVRKIGESAFKSDLYSYEQNYAELNILGGRGITVIDADAFKERKVTGLKPRQGMSIGDSAFYFVADMFEESTVKKVKEEVLDYLRKYSQIGSISDFVFSEDFTILKRYKGDCRVLTLPNVLQLGPKCFENNNRIEYVRLPQSIQRIGFGAFADCENLSRILIDNGVKEIDECAFNNCSKLYMADLGDSLRVIHNSAFTNCQSLEELNLGKSLLYIGRDAFRNCNALTGIKIPDTTVIIDNGAFFVYYRAQETPDTYVTLGKNVKLLNSNSFRNRIIKDIDIRTDSVIIESDVAKGFLNKEQEKRLNDIKLNVHAFNGEKKLTEQIEIDSSLCLVPTENRVRKLDAYGIMSVLGVRRD